MRNNNFITLILFLILAIAATSSRAGTPLWTFTPLTATTIFVPTNGTSTVHYKVTNQSKTSHTLMMNSIQGISQNTSPGSCANPFTLGYQQSCILKLVVDGAALQGNIVGGPIVCQQGNHLQCYQPSQMDSLNITKTTAPGETTLSVSKTNLALSVTGLTEYGVNGTPSSGVARTITITNTGSNTAVNLSIITPTWPSGTTNTTTCGSMLASGHSCTITITPGNTATSNGTNPCSSGTAPIAQAVQISASNAATVSTNVVVLSYGCIYQGGYLYYVDDTTNTSESIGGKVVNVTYTVETLAGLGWSTDATNTTAVTCTNPGINSGTSIWGIDQLSTPTNPSPNTNTGYSAMATQYPGQANCSGLTDGSCNTNNIYIYYTTQSPSYTSAANVCKEITDAGYDDWYLPSICEMDAPGDAGLVCFSTPQQNMVQSLSFLLATSCTTPSQLCGSYWSSTEGNDPTNSCPNFSALRESFSENNSHASAVDKSNQNPGVRCSRLLTQ